MNEVTVRDAMNLISELSDKMRKASLQEQVKIAETIAQVSNAKVVLDGIEVRTRKPRKQEDAE